MVSRGLRFDDDVAIALGPLGAALAKPGVASRNNSEDEPAERLNVVVGLVEVCRLILKWLDRAVRACNEGIGTGTRLGFDSRSPGANYA